MPAPQPTASEPSRQDPFRWHRIDIAAALDNFCDSDAASQRDYAQQQGIPQSTFNYWVRHYWASDDDPVAAFFRSEAGEQVLRHIVLAALSTFQLQGACGIRPVGTFLQRAGLDRFVACSPPATATWCLASAGATARVGPGCLPRPGTTCPGPTDAAQDHPLDCRRTLPQQ